MWVLFPIPSHLAWRHLIATPPSQIGEIKALAGVDFLTISPSLLEELKKSTDPVPK
jgi:transaldolase